MLREDADVAPAATSSILLRSRSPRARRPPPGTAELDQQLEAYFKRNSDVKANRADSKTARCGEDRKRGPDVKGSSGDFRTDMVKEVDSHMASRGEDRRSDSHFPCGSGDLQSAADRDLGSSMASCGEDRKSVPYARGSSADRNSAKDRKQRRPQAGHEWRHAAGIADLTSSRRSAMQMV